MTPACLAWNNLKTLPRDRPTLGLLALLILAGFVLSAGNSRTALIDPDESRYATISRNMIERHNYLEPWLGNAYYADKPPFFFWLMAGSLKLFGPNHIHLAVRSVPVMGGLLTLLAAYWLARSLFNPAVGLISVAGLLSSVFLIGAGKFVRMDIYLVAFITLGLAAFWQGYRQGRSSRWFLWMYPSFALAVLTKGPIGLALPTAMIVSFLGWRGEGRVWRRMHLASGLILLVLIAAPWFAYMVHLHPDYLREFFGRQNAGRFTDPQSGLGHGGSPLVYLATLLAGSLPWTGLVVLAVVHYGRSAVRRRSSDGPSQFLLMAALVTVGLFSLSVTKIFHYVFPAFVPLMILAARLVYEERSVDLRSLAIQRWVSVGCAGASATVVLLCLVSAAGAPWFHRHGQWTGLEDLYAHTGWGRWESIVSPVDRVAWAGLLLAGWWGTHRRGRRLTCTVGVFLLLTVDLSLTEFPRAADLGSCRRLADLVIGNAGPGDAVISGPASGRAARWSLPFYLGRARSVQPLEHVAEVSAFCRTYPATVVYLATDDYPYRQLKLMLDGRLKVLAGFGPIRLLVICPEGATRFSTNAAPGQDIVSAFGRVIPSGGECIPGSVYAK